MTNFFSINPDSEIIIDGQCKQGCSPTSTPTYKYKIYFSTNSSNKIDFFNTEWQSVNFSSSYVSSLDTPAITLMPSLFQVNYSSHIYWKIELEISLNPDAIGVSSIYLKKNQLPAYGDCSVDPQGGLAFDSYFYFRCFGWIDSDGFISRYTYFGNYFFQNIFFCITF